MKRREFLALAGGAAGVLPLSSPLFWPLAAQAQAQTKTDQATDDQVGQVATLQGSAMVTRGRAPAATALQINDPIFRNDALQTGANSALGVTFDDETTFSLSANTRIVVDQFVYLDSGKANAALFTVARGTAACVASKVASTGDMKIATPVATMGIRGTTGVVDVPEAGAAGGGAGGEPRIKLYPDTDGHVGRIEVFDRQGIRLGALTQGASAFSLRPGAGGRLAAVPFQIPPQEAARDRGVLQRLFASHAIGRQKAIQRRQLRERNGQQRNNPRQPRGLRQQNLQRPGGPNPRTPGPPRPQPRKPPPGQKQKH